MSHLGKAFEMQCDIYLRIKNPHTSAYVGFKVIESYQLH